mmetsp:Transcript_25028/g.36767  ORF Transcript_25028/g.36767 Transcript_25028/m.36767 type:complete len:122 (+) Transcript_25028:185-550(+)
MIFNYDEEAPSSSDSVEPSLLQLLIKTLLRHEESSSSSSHFLSSFKSSSLLKTVVHQPILLIVFLLYGSDSSPLFDTEKSPLFPHGKASPNNSRNDYNDCSMDITGLQIWLYSIVETQENC